MHTAVEIKLLIMSRIFILLELKMTLTYDEKTTMAKSETNRACEKKKSVDNEFSQAVCDQ